LQQAKDIEQSNADRKDFLKSVDTEIYDNLKEAPHEIKTEHLKIWEQQVFKALKSCLHMHASAQPDCDAVQLEIEINRNANPQTAHVSTCFVRGSRSQPVYRYHKSDFTAISFQRVKDVFESAPDRCFVLIVIAWALGICLFLGSCIMARLLYLWLAIRCGDDNVEEIGPEFSVRDSIISGDSFVAASGVRQTRATRLSGFSEVELT